MNNSKKLSVLMISGDASALEQESALFRRLLHYSDSCEHLTVLVFSRSLDGARDEGVLSVRSIKFSPFLSGLYCAIILGERIQKPDVVTVQDPFFLGLIGLFLSRHHRAPLHIQIHTDLFSPEFARFSLGNRIRLLIARIIIPHAEGLRVVSEKIKADVVSRRLTAASRVTVSPIPVVLPATLHVRLKKTGLHIVTVSRLAPEKDISLALRAFALVRTKRPDATFTIVGDGPLRQQLEHEAMKLGIAHLVTFVGQQNVVAPYYQKASVYLCTSRYEGYGLSLVEAAISGLPLVSTDVGIARELSPRTIVPRDAQKIADMLLSALSAPHVPALCLQDNEVYAERIVRDWQKVSQATSVGRRNEKVWFMVRYVISGASATIVNLSFLYFFTDLLGIWYVYSAAFAYPVAFVVSFALQKFWTFKNGTLSHIRSQFVFYVALGTLNMFLNSYLIYLVVETTGFHYLAAQLCIGVFIALWSLMFYRVFFKNQ